MKRLLLGAVLLAPPVMLAEAAGSCKEVRGTTRLGGAGAAATDEAAGAAAEVVMAWDSSWLRLVAGSGWSAVLLSEGPACCALS